MIRSCGRLPLITYMAMLTYHKIEVQQATMIHVVSVTMSM